MIWHSADCEQVCNELNVNTETGLYSDEVEKRLGIYGKNTVTNKSRKTLLVRFSEQLKSTGSIILLAASLLSLASNLIFGSGSLAEPVMMLILTALYAAVGAFERYSATEAHEQLKNTAAPKATVKREKEISVVAATELVPGDIIILSAGDYIPADARLIEAKNFHCDESVLTGNSVPEEKQADCLLDDITPLDERINMVYSGCSVYSGEAVAVVVSTGMDSEMGRAETINKVDKTQSSSPLKARMISASEKITVILLALCGLILLAGLIGVLIDRANFAVRFVSLITSVATLFASLIPEALIAATSVIITISIKKAATKKAVIKNLSTLETLGNISVICCDKTGNMTENDNSVAFLYDGESLCDYKEKTESLPSTAANLLTLAAICSDAGLRFENGKPIASGQPIEAAIVSAMAQSFKHSKDDLDSTCPRLACIPFDKARRLMTTVNMIDSKIYAITKGAPETVMDRCLPFDREKAENTLKGLAIKGLRVIAVAYKALDEMPLNPVAEEIESGLIFSGFIGINDPVSEDAARAVLLAKQAGIRTVMVTGDHPLTASAVAKELGILTDGMNAVTGSELAALSDKELTEKIDGISVFARVTPDDKVRIVKLLKAKGETVIMTGDGTQDTAALIEADIGCALGEYGTDVVKGASDITLADDRFSTIVAAVKEGRAVFQNIRKAAHFILSTQLSELIAILFAMIIFGISPLTSAALIWINLIVVTLPAFAVGSEPCEESVMKQNPRDKKEYFFTKDIMIEMFWQSGILALVTLLGFILGKVANGGSVSAGYTVCFIVLCLASALHTFNVRSVKDSFITVGIFKNKEILASLGICIVLLVIATLTPLRFTLGLAAISGRDWLIAILLSIIPLVVCEGVKLTRKLIFQINEEKNK